MRFKRCRLFNSAHLFKDILGENRDLFHFSSLPFLSLFPSNMVFPLSILLSVVKGNVFFFSLSLFWWYIYKYIYKDRVLKKICGILWKTNHEHSLGVFVKLPCMYSLHVNVVVQAWLQYIQPLRTQLPPLKPPRQTEETCS